MPPLQAPPDDDWVTSDDGDDERPGRSRWGWVAAAAVLVLLLAGGTWFLLSDGNRGTGGASASTSSSQSSAGPTGIQLDPATFIGRPADQVQTELEGAGLVVRKEQADAATLASAGQALDAGDVAGLDPSGVFAQPGTQVVLSVARSAYDPAQKASSDVPSPTTQARTSSAPATTSAAPTTPRTSTTPPSSSPAPETTATTAGGSAETTDVLPSESPVAEAPAANGAP
jgi:hypothetical protein